MEVVRQTLSTTADRLKELCAEEQRARTELEGRLKSLEERPAERMIEGSEVQRRLAALEQSRGSQQRKIDALTDTLPDKVRVLEEQARKESSKYEETIDAARAVFAKQQADAECGRSTLSTTVERVNATFAAVRADYVAVKNEVISTNQQLQLQYQQLQFQALQLAGLLAIEEQLRAGCAPSAAPGSRVGQRRVRTRSCAVPGAAVGTHSPDVPADVGSSGGFVSVNEATWTRTAAP